MSWTDALTLLLDLEGGYRQTNPPEGVTFAGIMRKYYEPWAQTHSRGGVWPPTTEAVASYYYDKYWTEFHCPEFADPADSVVLQLVVNLPPVRARQIIQIIVGAFPDGDIGPKTIEAIRKTVRTIEAMDICEALLLAQDVHYCDVRPVGDEDFKGLFNRTQKVRAALAQGHI